MKLETLRVERRKSGRLDVQLQLSTNPTELQENFRLLKNGVPVPALEAIFAESNSHVAMIRPNLKALRQVLGLTQEHFAKMAGVSQSQVCKVEMDIHAPGVKLLNYVKAVFYKAKQILDEERKENARLLKNGRSAPTLEAIFAEADRYIGRMRLNLNVGNPALYGLPESVTFRDCLKPNITDSDVEEALSRVLRLAKPSQAFTLKVLLVVFERFESQKEVGRL